MSSNRKVDASAILKNPAAVSQHFVDLLAREFFGGSHEGAENGRDLAL